MRLSSKVSEMSPKPDPVVNQLYASHWPKIAKSLEAPEGEKSKSYSRVIERVLAQAFLAGKENIPRERRDPESLDRRPRFQVKLGKKTVTGHLERRAAPAAVLKMASRSPVFQGILQRAKRKEEMVPFIREQGGIARLGTALEPLQQDVARFIRDAHEAGRSEIRKK